MPTFVSKFLDNTKDNESPASFWKWAAYAAIAAVLRDNCYRKKKNGAIYPNIYVLFVAPSSGHRKNNPIDHCQTLVTRVGNTKVIAGRASIQGMMDEIARGETAKNGSMPIKPGSAACFAPELSAGIVADPQAIQMLTDIYDYKANPYKNLLRTGPVFTINKIIFSMLAGTNLEISKDFLNHVAIKGGFIARTFVITPNEFRKGFSEFDDESSTTNEDLISACLPMLQEIGSMKGEYAIEDNAKEEYRNWYLPWREGYLNRQDPTGIVGRIHTGIIKISMILASNDLSLIIRKKHIEEAIDVGRQLLPNYNVFVMSNGRSTISEAGGLIIQELCRRPYFKIKRMDLLADHWNEFDGELLDKVVATLEQAGMIRSLLENNLVAYQLTEQCVERINR